MATKEMVLVGTISARPDLKPFKLDFGAVRLMARVVEAAGCAATTTSSAA